MSRKVLLQDLCVHATVGVAGNLALPAARSFVDCVNFSVDVIGYFVWLKMRQSRDSHSGYAFF